MPITALSHATVQLLGSAQVLTTPTSLIKELIDNALDAKATSIDILISKNTLDKLEVRDNGQGIASEDFDCLGRRGHTSKLRNFEELRFIGGVSLGFRGEALASAVQLGNVSVITKTEGELVATKLVLKAPGGVHQQTTASHPVGTTVSVLNFMDKIPVRKQTFEREAAKTLAKINQLIRSYVLARPSIKFGFKVTNGGKGSFSFAPRSSDGIKEAVSQVIGRNTVLECFEKSLTLSELQPWNTVSGDQDAVKPSKQKSSHLLDGCFTIEAFLPKKDAEASKVGSGQYLSIDSRPVSHEKGTMKKIVAMFNKYIRATLTDPSVKLKNPFIQLNIKCPIASYDANVEPAKDDVLFCDEAIVLELFENLLKSVYGDLQHTPPVSAPKSLATKHHDFELLLARDPPPPAPTSPPTPATDILSQKPDPTSSSPTLQASSPVSKQPSTAGESSLTDIEESFEEKEGSDRRNSAVVISNGFSEDVDDGHHLSRNEGFRPNLQPVLDRETAGGYALNPWIIAKMTAPIRCDRVMSEPNCAVEEASLDISHSSLLESDQAYCQKEFVPLITISQQKFCSDDIRALQPSISRQNPIVRSGTEEVGKDFSVEEELPLQPKRRNDFVSARNIPDIALISRRPPQSPKGPPKSRGPNRPFISPLTTAENGVAPSDRMVQTTLLGNNPQPRRQSEGGHVMSVIEPSSDLAWAMDFEQRKEDATRLRREELHVERMEGKSSGSYAPPRSSPHKNRYNAAIACLKADRTHREPSEQPKESLKTTMPDGDPRAYFMRQQKSLTAKNSGQEGRRMMSRAKSTRLPLEKTPEGQHLQNLVFNMQTDMENLQSATEKLAKADMYVRRGSQSAGLIMKPDEAPGITRKIMDVVGLWMNTDEGKKYEVEYIFDFLIHSKSLST